MLHLISDIELVEEVISNTEVVLDLIPGTQLVLDIFPDTELVLASVIMKLLCKIEYCYTRI